MKILLKAHDQWTHTVSCRNCQSILEVVEEDITAALPYSFISPQSGYEMAFRCGVCGDTSRFYETNVEVVNRIRHRLGEIEKPKGNWKPSNIAPLGRPLLVRVISRNYGDGQDCVMHEIASKRFVYKSARAVWVYQVDGSCIEDEGHYVQSWMEIPE